MDTRLLKDSFAAVAPRGPELVEWFYATLFHRGGQEIRDMFPPFMSAQRDRLLGALVEVVTNVDDLDTVAAYLAGLGRDHRKFGVIAEHYELVGESLLSTLAHFAGDAWTDEVSTTWASAYGLIAQVMQEAAGADSASPPWWDAVVTSVERRPPDILIMRVRLARPLAYQPGQSMSVQFDDVPRVWRFYSPANMPGDGQELVFHIKVVDGGLLSMGVAQRTAPGSKLRVGPPVGQLRLADSKRDMLMVAGSTGLAPLMSILEKVAADYLPPKVDVFFGARTPEGLYDLEALEKLAAGRDWLTITTAVSDAGGFPGYQGARGGVVDVMAREGNWTDRDAYICGPTGMVKAAAGRLESLGIPRGQIHTEDFGLEG